MRSEKRTIDSKSTPSLHNVSSFVQAKRPTCVPVSAQRSASFFWLRSGRHPPARALRAAERRPYDLVHITIAAPTQMAMLKKEKDRQAYRTRLIFKATASSDPCAIVSARLSRDRAPQISQTTNVFPATLLLASTPSSVHPRPASTWAGCRLLSDFGGGMVLIPCFARFLAGR